MVDDAGDASCDMQVSCYSQAQSETTRDDDGNNLELHTTLADSKGGFEFRSKEKMVHLLKQQMFGCCCKSKKACRTRIRVRFMLKEGKGRGTGGSEKPGY